MILVVEYGMGNLRSIEKALKRIGAEYTISHEPKDIPKADKVILPGVGHFGKAMQNLNDMGLVHAIREHARAKPLLGICLGMQLLFERSEEGDAVGLSLIRGEVRRFRLPEKYKIPHIGWNSACGDNLPGLFEGIEQDSNFYFVHSYHAVLEEDLPHSLTDYGYNFVSSVAKGRIWGTQFHPEKSQMKGLRILKNFAGL